MLYFFLRQTRMEEATRNYLSTKLLHQSPLKRKADAAASTSIPLTTTHGGHPMHVLIIPRASKPLEELSTKQKRRRTLSAELHKTAVEPPPPPNPPPIKLTPIEGLQFRQLRGQFTNETLRSMRSFLNSKHCNFLPSEKKMRDIEQQLHVPLSNEESSSSSIRVEDIIPVLSEKLVVLSSAAQLAVVPRRRGPLWAQVQIDKGGTTTKGILKIINVEGELHQRNIIPFFMYKGDESYEQIRDVTTPLLKQLYEFQLPPVVARSFSSLRLIFSADMKATQTVLGMSVSSVSTFPCPYCLISRDDLRSRLGVSLPYQRRTSLQHGWDVLTLQFNRDNDERFAKEHHNCIRKPPFMYGLPEHAQNILIGMPVLHISIGIGSKLLKLAEKLAPDASQFTALLSSLNLTWHAYHGNTLVGPQVHRLVHGRLYEKVLSPLAIRQTEPVLQCDQQTGRMIMRQQPCLHHARMLELFRLFEQAYNLYTLDRFLSESEITSLCAACTNFGAKFVDYYPNESITPKLHVLSVEFPRFARENGTVGLLAEQAIESFHAQVNQLHRAYAAMGECRRKYELIFQAASRLHNPLIPHFEPPPRICSICQKIYRGKKLEHTACRALRASLAV